METETIESGIKPRTHKDKVQCLVYECPFCSEEVRRYSNGNIVAMCDHYQGFDVEWNCVFTREEVEIA